MIFPNLRAHLYWTSFYRLVTLLMNCHLSSSTRTRLIEDQPIMYYIHWHYYSLNTLLLVMFNNFLDVNWLVSWIVCSLCKMVIQPEWATFMPSQYLSEWYETNLTFFLEEWKNPIKYCLLIFVLNALQSQQFWCLFIYLLVSDSKSSIAVLVLFRIFLCMLTNDDKQWCFWF